MKKVKFISLLVAVIILLELCIIPMPTSKALSEEDLVISGGVTISKDSTIDQISEDYGTEPKLVTPSAFGGEMCTWYTGDYQNVLYVETNEDGVIMAAGAMSGDFQSNLYSAGDKVTGGTVNRFEGTVSTALITNYATGVIVYQKDLLTDEVVENYLREYVSKKQNYRKYIGQHAVIMLNNLLVYEGKSTRAEYNEDVFDKATKISETMSLSDYAEKNKKEPFLMQAGNDINYLTLYKELPNPLRPADGASLNEPNNTLKYAYITYGVYEDSSTSLGYGGGVTLYYVAEELFEPTNETGLTEEEQEKYEQAKAMYEKSLEEFNDGSYEEFEEEPQYEDLPLVAGKIKENKLQGSVDYLNAIRIGAGLSPVELNLEASNAAQHKAVLTRYLTINGISNPDSHFPPQPEGVSDEFYDTAQSFMTENLYSGDIIDSIAQALHDGQGDPIKAGHRYNLLDPDRTSFGIGYANGQSCHKLTSGGSSNIDMVAWPSIGITPTEAFYNGGYWTFKLYTNDYSIDMQTTVKVKCLNTNKEWIFNDRSAVDGNTFVRGSDMISFRSSDLDGENDYVYEITIENLMNEKTGTHEDYTYRSVFKSLTQETEIVYPTSISLEPSQISGVRGATQVIDVNFIPDNTTEVVTKWSSSNPNVATVNQYGEVTITGIGTATITAETLNGKKATCTVQGIDGIAGLKFEQEKYYIAETKSETLKVTEINGIPFDESEIKWSVSDSEVASIRNGIITIASGMAGKEITVTAEYGGKKATCQVVAITRYDQRPTFKVSVDTWPNRIEKGETMGIIFSQAEDNTHILKFECDIPYDANNLEVVKVEPLIDEITAEVTEPGNVHIKFSADDLIDINKDLVHITFKSITSNYSENDILPTNGIYYVLGDDEEQEATMQYMATIITLEQNLLKGDVNGDGVVGLYDAFQILRTVILGDGDLSEDEQYIMDYNDDGEVGLYDAFQFLRQVILS